MQRVIPGDLPAGVLMSLRGEIVLQQAGSWGEDTLITPKL
jgi:hypothetical protein